MLDDDTIRRALAPHILDGGEASHIVDELARTVADGKDNPLLIASARFDAKRRLRALLKDVVPLEAVLDVIARLSGEPTDDDFGEILRRFAEAQLRIRKNRKQRDIK